MWPNASLEPQTERSLPGTQTRPPTDRVFLQRYGSEAHDEVRQTPMRRASDATGRHGPYFELTYKANGKTAYVKLSAEAAPLYRAAARQ